MDQEDISRIILGNFAALHMQNATLAAKAMKDFITTLTGLPPSPIETHLAQLNNNAVTQATTIAEAKERNSALMKNGRDLIKE
jgi:RecA/RadA recombinase